MRGFIVVLDSFGVGAAPDATAFGDEGASTIKQYQNPFILTRRI